MKRIISAIYKRMPALPPIMLALAGFTIFLFGRHTLETAQDQEHAARTAVTNAAADVSRAEDLVLRNQLVQARLATLHAKGLDQPIDDLRWHETLDGARQDLHLFALHYELPPEHPAEQAADELPSSLRAAGVRFQAVLRHEEDFLALMRRLEQVGTGVRTRHCRLALTQEGDSPARLNARCELERTYIQVSERDAGQADNRSAPLPEKGEPTLLRDQER